MTVSGQFSCPPAGSYVAASGQSPVAADSEYGNLDSDYLFVGLWSRPYGRPLTYHAVADLFTRLSRRTGVAATPHMFRHTYATRLLRSGVKAEVVQKLLGHASVSTTIDTYGHLTIEDVRRDLVLAGCLEATEV